MRAKEWLVHISKDISTILWTDKFPFFLKYFKYLYKYIYVFARFSSDVTAISFEEWVFENGFDCLISNPVWCCIEAKLQKVCHCPKTYGLYLRAKLVDWVSVSNGSTGSTGSAGSTGSTGFNGVSH